MTVLLGYRYSRFYWKAETRLAIFFLRTKLLVNIPPKTPISFGRSKRMCVRLWLEVVQGYSAWWAISDSLRPRQTTPITEMASQQPHTCTTTEALLMAALFICTSSTTTYTHLSLYSAHWLWLLPCGDVLSLYIQLGHCLWNHTYVGLASCCKSVIYTVWASVSPMWA